VALQTALRRTPSTLASNPVLFVPVLVLALLQVPQLLLQSSAPILASIVSLALSALYLVLVPFIQAGLIGMADEALDGRTSLATFVAAGKEYFVSVFVVYLILLAVNIVLGVVAFVAGIVGVVGLSPGGAAGSGPNTALLAVVAVVVLAAVLAYLVVAFLIQFYGQAIVIDDYGAIDSITHSVGVVRRNLVSVLGYTLLVGVLAGAFGLVVGLGSALAAPSMSGTPVDPFAVGLPSLGAVGASALVVVLGTLFGGFFGTLSVAYYRELTAETRTTAVTQ